MACPHSKPNIYCIYTVYTFRRNDGKAATEVDDELAVAAGRLQELWPLSGAASVPPLPPRPPAPPSGHLPAAWPPPLLPRLIPATAPPPPPPPPLLPLRLPPPGAPGTQAAHAAPPAAAAPEEGGPGRGATTGVQPGF